jgi:hypothetical protein
VKCKWNYAAIVRVIMPDANHMLLERFVRTPHAIMGICALLLGAIRIMRRCLLAGADIILLTIRRKYIYICYGQKQTFKLKSPKPPAPGQPQPPSGKSCRPAVCHFRFFRPARSRSGQVRDGAQGTNGPPDHQWQRCFLRVHSTLVLPGASSTQARRSARLGSAKARTSAQAQAQRRGNDIYSRTEIGRSVIKPVRSGASHPGSLWPQGSHAQCRTGARALGKKTALIGSNLLANDAADRAYEELRDHILANSSGGLHYGLILLLREGVAAWLERRITVESTEAKITQPHACASKSLLSEPLQAELVSVLAGIALSDRKEIRQ